MNDVLKLSVSLSYLFTVSATILQIELKSVSGMRITISSRNYAKNSPGNLMTFLDRLLSRYVFPSFFMSSILTCSDLVWCPSEKNTFIPSYYVYNFLRELLFPRDGISFSRVIECHAAVVMLTLYCMYYFTILWRYSATENFVSCPWS